MTQQESEVSPAVGWETPALQRAANLAAHLLGGAGVAFGAVSALAKRRQSRSDGASDGRRESRGDEQRKARHPEPTEGDRAERRESRQDRPRSQQEENGRDHHARNESVDQEQDANTINNSDTSGDTADDTADDTAGDSSGDGNSNAGSGAFDNPLARKAVRRAKDFDNTGGDDNTVTADTDDGSHHFETNSISFTSGPDGLEVVTRNIDYSAPPTPTPTPFPTLTLPERDRLDVFGDRVIAAPTAGPADNGATDGAAPPPATDSGTNTSTGSRPTPAPPADDTSGGDNTSDFLS